MQTFEQPHDRRDFMGLAIGLLGSALSAALLAGCNGPITGNGGGDSITPASAGIGAQGGGAAMAHPLNLLLTLAYIGGQYYGYAVDGAGLPAALTTGTGTIGSVTGLREASFTDPLVAHLMGEIAEDKHAHVVALRDQIGVAAAAQPQIDFSVVSGGAFAAAAQAAGVVPAGGRFDPYASDTNFLLGALLIENVVAAAYRTSAMQDGATTTIQAQLAHSIYHGGLVRALLDDKATADPSIGTAVANVGTMLAMLDGTGADNQVLEDIGSGSSNLFDADQRPIPFTRTTAQVLTAICLSGGSFGGFLPAGANGLTV